MSAEDMREKMCSTCVIAPTAFSQATCMTVASWITLTTGVCDSTISPNGSPLSERLARSKRRRNIVGHAHRSSNRP